MIVVMGYPKDIKKTITIKPTTYHCNTQLAVHCIGVKIVLEPWDLRQNQRIANHPTIQSPFETRMLLLAYPSRTSALSDGGESLLVIVRERREITHNRERR